MEGIRHTHSPPSSSPSSTTVYFQKAEVVKTVWQWRKWNAMYSQTCTHPYRYPPHTHTHTQRHTNHFDSSLLFTSPWGTVWCELCGMSCCVQTLCYLSMCVQKQPVWRDFCHIWQFFHDFHHRCAMMSAGIERQVSSQHNICNKTVRSVILTWMDFVFVCLLLSQKKKRPIFVCLLVLHTWLTEHMLQPYATDKHAAACQLAICCSSPRYSLHYYTPRQSTNPKPKHHAFIKLQIKAIEEKSHFGLSTENRHYLSFRLIATLLRHSYISKLNSTWHLVFSRGSNKLFVPSTSIRTFSAYTQGVLTELWL